MDPALLQAGDNYIHTQCPTRYSFLVVRNGYLVWERHYHGMAASGTADVRSVSRSILSLLIGSCCRSHPGFGGSLPDQRTHPANRER